MTGYYSGDEDAFDMRKPLRRDPRRSDTKTCGEMNEKPRTEIDEKLIYYIIL